ncbi:hypothetical protein JB92DRAFT_2719357 [Gautieria morchelliformis]|nr:hypothetical protein JB92DRAFT_2719357 [Gautieria morchelliformis]
MSYRSDRLSVSTVIDLFSVDGVYTLLYAFLFGASMWVNFFGGVIAYRALPRAQFGVLQHRTFPVFFLSSEAVSSLLLTLWTLSHPDVLTNWYNPAIVDVAQAWALATVLLTQGANDWVVGPLTSKTMFERHRLEKVEKKNYNDQGVSDEMKALNRRFGTLHGISYLLSMGAVVALGFHGLWIGNVGLQGY